MFVTVAFAFNTVAWSAPSISVTRPSPRAIRQDVRLPVEKIEIPASLGRIEDYFVPGTPSKPFIVHIQDAHSSYDAQIKIKELLKQRPDNQAPNASPDVKDGLSQHNRSILLSYLPYLL